MKILIATDAWHPQVNGVVRTLGHVAREAQALGVDIEFLDPDRIPHPADAELSGNPAGAGRAGRVSSGGSSTSRPDAIHIATEGPLGHAMRRVCLRRGLPFTTSFHTRFPDYLAERLPVPERWTARCDLGLAAPLSRAGRRGAGGDADACCRTDRRAASRT